MVKRSVAKMAVMTRNDAEGFAFLQKSDRFNQIQIFKQFSALGRSDNFVLEFLFESRATGNRSFVQRKKHVHTTPLTCPIF
jgi:hypothetical protein